MLHFLLFLLYQFQLAILDSNQKKCLLVLQSYKKIYPQPYLFECTTIRKTEWYLPANIAQVPRLSTHLEYIVGRQFLTLPFKKVPLPPLMGTRH